MIHRFVDLTTRPILPGIVLNKQARTNPSSRIEGYWMVGGFGQNRAGFVIPDSQFQESGSPPKATSHGTLSPDRTKLAFTLIDNRLPSSGQPQDRIRVVNVDGTGSPLDVALADASNTSMSLGLPCWSPDGSQIVYFASYDATHSLFGKIRVVNADGTGDTLLYSRQPGARGFTGYPLWNYAGTKIAWMNLDTLPNTTSMGVWTMNADGSSPTKLVGIGTGFDGGLLTQGLIGWSHDDSLIAFSDGVSTPSPLQKIKTVDAAGTTVTTLISSNQYVQSSVGGGPSDICQWWPDDSKLLIVNNKYGTEPKGVISTIDMAGITADISPELRVVTSSAPASRPGIWPDDSRLYWHDVTDNAIYSCELDGSDVHLDYQLSNDLTDLTPWQSFRHFRYVTS